MKVKTLAGCIWVILHCSTAWTKDQKPPRVYEWPADFSQYVTRHGDRLLYGGINAVFESLSDIDVFFAMNEKSSIGIGYERRLYETREINNAWILEDHFRVRFKYTHAIREMLNQTLRTVGLNVGLMVTPGVEWIRFYKIKPSEYSDIPEISDEKNSLEKSDWYQKLILSSKKKNKKENMNDSHDAFENEAKEEYQKNFWDPSIKPRFTKILAPFTIPFRLPYSAAQFKKQKDEEVFIYSGTGSLELSAGVSMPMANLMPGLTLDAGASVKVYIAGEYRVAIMRENERYSKVRVARIAKVGRGESTGVKTQGNVMASWLGFEVSYTPKTVPFEITDESFVSRITDWSFRYDMKNPRAVEAFNKAIWGLLSESQIIAAEEEEKQVPENERAVSLISNRKGTQETKVTGVRSKMDFLYDAWKRRTFVFSNFDTELKDGSHKILKWESHHQKQAAFLGGAFKDSDQFSYSILLDYYTLSRGQPNAYSLIAEASSVDYFTYGNELNETIHEVEDLLGNQDLVDDLPERIEIREKDRERRAMYGRSSFYYGFNLTQHQVDRILNTDPELMKKTLLEVIPKKSVANKAFARWKKANKAKEIRDRLEALSEMLHVKTKKNEFIKVFQYLLDGETVDVFANFFTSPTGRIDLRKNPVVSVDQLRLRSEPGVNVEQQVLRFGGDTLAQISALKVTPTPAAQGILEFSCAQKPSQIYLRLQRSGAFSFSKPLIETRVLNSNSVQQGQNKFEIKLMTDQVIGRLLGERLTANDYYTLSIAYSVDGKKWGPVVSTRFLTKK